jgi:peptide/nickel transport system substrate-binding protein
MRFRVLGPLEVEADNGPVVLGGPKERLLLALLLTRPNQVVSVDALVRGLWGEQPPPTAAKTLQSHVKRLRRALEPERARGIAGQVLITRPPGYLLRVGPGTLDTMRFEELTARARRALADGGARAAGAMLREALGLWRGQAFEEFADSDVVVAEADRLGELRLGAVEDRIEADLQLGRHRELVAELEGLVREQPLRERLWAQLMLALYRSGRQADALLAYQRARSVLVEELGIDPGAELRRVHAAILAQAPGLDLPAPAEVSPTRALPEALKPTGPVFAGRTAELTWLRDAWTRAAQGRGGVVFVAARQGMGKTRLAAALAQEVHDQGGRVLYGRCAASASDPLQPFADALTSLGASPPDLPAPGAGQSLAARSRALADLLAGRSDQAVLLVLDDLHLAQEPTLEALAGLAAAAVTRRLLVLGAYREEPASAGLAGLVERLDPSGAAQRRLGPFGREQVPQVLSLQQGARDGAHTAAERQPEQTPTETASHSTHLRLVQDKPASDVASLRESGGWRRAVPARLGRSGRRLAAAGLAVVVAATAALVAVRAADRGRIIAAIEANSLGLIDTTSNGLVGQVPLGVRSGQVAVGEGAVWVANAETGKVSKVAPATRRVVERIPVGREPAGVVAADGAVWVANSGGRSVSWINPTTDTVVKTVPVGNGPTGIALGLGAVWVANSLDNSVSRIDPNTGKVVGTVPVGGTPSGVAVGLGAVWVTNASDNTVSRISPTPGSAVRSIPVGNGPRAIAVGADAVWVANSLDGTVSRINPASDAVVATVPVGDGPSAVAVDPGGVWAASEVHGTVSRLDPDTNTVAVRIEVASAPAGAAVVGDELWVATRGAPTSHRGGTLRVASTPDNLPVSIDPADALDSFERAQILLLTNDGLVGYKRVGGIEGSELVANLATSLPRPTAGGTSYVFRLRPDIHYSTGQLVKPEDVRASIERGFKLRSLVADYFLRGVVGGQACTRRPEACDLSKGIVTDPAANTVTFHLTRPDPEFLVKLALATALVVPAGTPARDVGTSPVPATGPYMIQQFVPRGTVVLVRNPHFREWSRAAQPDGYPDRIEWTPSGQDPVDAVLAGRFDYSGHWKPPDGDRGDQLTTRYASQAHLYPFRGQFAMYLNTRVPPFDDLRVRRALSYAVDRRAVQNLYPGPAEITCQYLPPNFPGYQPYCPYTLNPSPAGAWTAPDRAAATQLIKASGTRGMRVTVWSAEDFVDVSRYFVKLLDSLGYHARLRIIGPDFEFNDSRNKAQLAAYWFQNAPSPSELTAPLRCRSFVPNSGDNQNTAQFCSRELEARIERALRLQATDPAAAGLAWAAVDRHIVDQAPAISLLVPQGIDLVSTRVGNYQHNPAWGAVLSQLWVV